MVPNAYNFGVDTAEVTSNVVDTMQYNPDNGEIFAQITAGSGSPCGTCIPEGLYSSSQVSTLTVMSPINTGTLYVWSPSSSIAEASQTPFVNGAPQILLYPGTYCLSVVNGNVSGGGAELTLSPGEALTVNKLASKSLCLPGPAPLCFQSSGNPCLTGTNCPQNICSNNIHFHFWYYPIWFPNCWPHCIGPPPASTYVLDAGNLSVSEYPIIVPSNYSYTISFECGSACPQSGSNIAEPTIYYWSANAWQKAGSIAISNGTISGDLPFSNSPTPVIVGVPAPQTSSDTLGLLIEIATLIVAAVAVGAAVLYRRRLSVVSR